LFKRGLRSWSMLDIKGSILRVDFAFHGFFDDYASHESPKQCLAQALQADHLPRLKCVRDGTA
jgi:hypothetical protein